MAAPRDPDDNLIVLFKYVATKDEARSLAEGRAVFDDVEMCEVRVPGSRDVKVFPSTAFTQWVVDPLTGEQNKQTYAERFSHQYRQFKARQAQTVTGTPLEFASFLTEARRAELRAQNVYTVEMLAAIDGVELPYRGPEERSWFIYYVRLAAGLDRDAVAAGLAARGVATRPYLPAIHLQPPYRERFGFAEGMLPVTERVSRSTLALPFFVQLEDDDVAHVASSLREVLQEL
jgi:dTDP-4-amino-4,6-dideoxygalactose transaminase